MFDNLQLRHKILAITAVPVNVFVILALVGVGLYGEPVLALLAALGAIATIGVGQLVARNLTAQVSQVSRSLQIVTDDHLPRIVGALDDVDAEPTEVARALIGTASGDLALAADPTAGDGGGDGPTEPTVDGGDPGDDADIEALDQFAALPPDGDELGDLQERIDQVGTRLADLLSAHEETTNKRLGDVVRNLARRHQSLLNRQIEHIDWLEDTEQAPDRLEQLFKLDHLATRLRRSSETVLVLAGGETTRPRGGPAPIATVLRVAMGETEAYTKIKLRSVEEAVISGGPAFDLAHLLSELLENATRFSPPETPVELHACRLGDGSYQITIVDRGVGMDEAKLAEANRLVSAPPDLNLAVGRSIGFIVVGRLAGRIGATVDLTHTPGSGVTASIVVPAFFVLDGPDMTAPMSAATAGRLAGRAPDVPPIPSSTLAPIQPPAVPASLAGAGPGDADQPPAPTRDPVEVPVAAPAPTPSPPPEQESEQQQQEALVASGSTLINDPIPDVGGEPGPEPEEHLDPAQAALAELISAPDPQPTPASDEPYWMPEGSAGQGHDDGAAAARVGAESSSALAKLLGVPVESEALAPTNDWEVPTVDTDSGAPLKSRTSEQVVLPLPSSDPPATPEPQPSAEPQRSAESQPSAQSQPPPGVEPPPPPPPTPGTEAPGPSSEQAPLSSRSRKARRGRRKAQPMASLDEAIPSGAAFESGIESLLDLPTPTTDAPSAPPDASAVPSPDPRTATDPSGPAALAGAPKLDAVPAPPPAGPERRAQLDTPPHPAADNGIDPAAAGWTPPTVSTGADGSLQRRDKGATDIPVATGPRAKASTRRPEEIRSMITRYRDALKGKPPADAGPDEATDLDDRKEEA